MFFFVIERTNALHTTTVSRRENRSGPRMNLTVRMKTTVPLASQPDRYIFMDI